jgi:hypothetical protein
MTAYVAQPVCQLLVALQLFCSLPGCLTSGSADSSTAGVEAAAHLLVLALLVVVQVQVQVVVLLVVVQVQVQVVVLLALVFQLSLAGALVLELLPLVVLACPGWQIQCLLLPHN